MTTDEQPSSFIHSADDIALGEQVEAACALAARLYSEGKDTTEADAEVERLMALLEA